MHEEIFNLHGHMTESVMITMAAYWIWCMFVLVVVTDAETKDLCADQSSSGLILRCPRKNHNIYKPDVLAYSSDECTDVECVGNTTDLIVQKNKCQQKGECIITPPKYFIISPKVMNSQCPFTRPQSLSFKGGLCMNQNSIYDICDNLNNNQSTSSKEFIVRSHSSYPWIYKQEVFIPQHKGIRLNNSCALVYYPRDTHITIQITVSDIDISEDTDSINITSGCKTFVKSINNYDIGKSFTIDLKNVRDRTIYFQFINRLPGNTASRTNGGNGFIICVKADAENGKSACEGMITPNLKADINKKSADPKARSRKGKKKRKGRRGCKHDKANKKCRNRKRKKSKGERKNRKRRKGTKRKGRKKKGKTQKKS